MTGQHIDGDKQRDFLLSVILSLDTLARAGKLTNENVLEVTTSALAKIPHAKRSVPKPRSP